MRRDVKVVIEAVTGSQAYGLATEDSDIDLKGVYVASTKEVLGLFPPKDTIDHIDPDYSYHEVGKFVRLALKCNPTLMELLFMPEYRVLTEEGKMLVDARQAFLSKIVYKSYGGYAISQARKLQRRGDGEFSGKVKGRYSKHARHCFRLLQQGRELLETGNLTVKVSNPEELFKIGQMSPEDLVAKFEVEFAEFDKIETDLPKVPDYNTINAVLLSIRGMN